MLYNSRTPSSECQHIEDDLLAHEAPLRTVRPQHRPSSAMRPEAEAGSAARKKRRIRIADSYDDDTDSGSDEVDEREAAATTTSTKRARAALREGSSDFDEPIPEHLQRLQTAIENFPVRSLEHPSQHHGDPDRRVKKKPLTRVTASARIVESDEFCRNALTAVGSSRASQFSRTVTAVQACATSGGAASAACT